MVLHEAHTSAQGNNTASSTVGCWQPGHNACHACTLGPSAGATALWYVMCLPEACPGLHQVVVEDPEGAEVHALVIPVLGEGEVQPRLKPPHGLSDVDALCNNRGNCVSGR
jgi:hypothetical protein